MIKADDLFTKIRKIRWIDVCIGISCTVFLLIAQLYKIPLVTESINKIQNNMYDYMISSSLKYKQQSPKVVIIDIDEKSIEMEGRWPWARNVMANLINQLKQEGVVSIALDIVLPEAEINYAQGLKQKVLQIKLKPPKVERDLLVLLDEIAPKIDNDQLFANTLLDHNVILGFLFDNKHIDSAGTLPQPLKYEIANTKELSSLQLLEFQSYKAPLDLFMKQSQQAGFVTNIRDSDGTIRRGLLLATYNGNLYPSLALETVMNYLLVDKVMLMTQNHNLYGIQLEGVFIPTNSQGQILIPFWGQSRTLNYFPATDVLSGKVPAEQLQGAIAVIGSTRTLLNDLHQSPVAQSFPGVEMVGNIIQGIINHGISSEFDWHTLHGVLIFLCIGVTFGILLSVWGTIIKLLISISTFLIILVSPFYVFTHYQIYIPTAFLLILIALQSLVNFYYSFIIEKSQKRKIRQLFDQYVPSEYVEELIQSNSGQIIEGQTRSMTVLFSDIRDFTSISEVLAANQVGQLLNIFFTSVTEIIFKHRGTVDKYVGDMVVAFWGAPLEDKEHSLHAIQASLSIIKQLPAINATLLEHNLPALNIGIGLSTGLMSVGDMGSEFRRAYTVLGDNVNLGSRLQDLTKFYKVNILAGFATQTENDIFVWRPIDKIEVKGRKTTTLIYEPLCTIDEATPELLEQISAFKLALQEYYARNWSSAKRKFTVLAADHPDVFVYGMFLKRSELHIKKAPPKNWDGVYVHNFK